MNWISATTQLRQLSLAMATLALLIVCATASSNSDWSPTDSSSGTSSDSSIEASVQQLDQALDKSLEEFDQRMATANGSNNLNELDENAASADSETDILSPRGNAHTQPADPSVDLDILVGDDNMPIFGGDGEPSPPTPTSDNANNNASAAESSQSASPNSDRSSSSQPGQGTESTPLPDDIGDGQGDNIVQRQIRQAAIEEADPLLRERLWDEYRKLKNP